MTSARDAARSQDDAMLWIRARHGLREGEESRIEWAALTSEPGSWPRRMQRSRRSAEANREAIADVAELRVIVGRLMRDDAYSIDMDEPPVFARLRELRAAVEAFARHWEVDLPERGSGDRDEVELRREIVLFTRAYLKSLTAHSAVNTTATDAAIVAIAYGHDPPVLDGASEDGNDPWERRVASWRAALRRLRGASEAGSD